MATGGWGTLTSNPFATSKTDAADVQDIDLESNSSEPPKPPPSAPSAGSNPFAGSGAWGNGNLALETASKPSKTSKAAASFNSAMKSTFSKTKEAVSVVTGGPEAPVPTMRDEQLSQREAELKRREEELKKREAALDNNATLRRKNWPFKCMPILYHSIADDIPPWHRNLVRQGYYIWLLSAIGFLWNWLVILMSLFAGSQLGTKIQWFFMASLVSALGLPGSFLLYYRSLYFAAQTDGSFWIYMKTFAWTGLHVFWCCWTVLALPVVGDYLAGVFTMLSWFTAGNSAGTTFGIFAIINVVIWGLAAFGSFILMGRAIAAFRAADYPRKKWEEQNRGPWVKA